MFIIETADNNIGPLEKGSQMIIIVMDNDMIIFGVRITKDYDPIVSVHLNIVDIGIHLPASLSDMIAFQSGSGSNGH
jgi:hypothetical protein